MTEAGPAEAAPAGGVDWSEPGATNGMAASDAISASMLARLRGEAVEDLSQRTESSQTFALPDGQWRADISTGPEWVATGEDRATEAGWKRLDTRLVRYSDGSYRPRAHPGSLVFAGGGSGVTDVVAGVDAEGRPFTLVWEGVLPAPVVEADAIRYVDVRPGIDLVFYVTATGYEQFFVAKDANALKRADKLTLTAASPDGDLRKSGDEVVVRGRDGDAVAQVSDVAVWDAESDSRRMVPVASMAAAPIVVGDGVPTTSVEPSAEPDLNVPPTEVEVPAEVTVAGGEATITVDAADIPFGDGDVYPVVIDPSVNLSLTFDTYVSNASTVDKSSETELRIGTWDSGASKYRSYLNVNVSPILGKKVTSATFKLYNWHSWSCTAKNWEVWATSTTSSSTRWTNMPAFTNKYATVSTTKGYSSSCADGWVTADVTTLVHNWSVATSTTRGMAVKASSETDNFYWKRFYSGNNASNKPVLSVTYNSYPNTASSVKVNGTAPTAGSTYYTNDTTPTFSATVSDPDGGTVKGKFSLSGGTAVAGSSVASGSASSYTPSALANGASRTVAVWANDGSLDSKSSANPSWTVVVDTAAPGATTITSPQVVNGQWLDTAPASMSATLAATDAVKFEYKVDGGAVKTVTGSGTATVTGLPRTNGGHKVEARAVDRANNTSGWTTFEYGIGSVGIAAPVAVYKTTDTAAIVASAPPGTNGAVERALYWRAAGTANDPSYSDATGSALGWTKIVDLADTPQGVNPAVDYMWGAAAAAAASGKERVPYLMEVQACFTYTYTSDTLCTWRKDVATHASVLRIPHAFGDSFPVAAAGPGQVAMWTGEFNTATTDLEVPGYTGTLSISRSYSTFAGGLATSVFGPGWAPSFEGSDVGAAGLTVYDGTADDGVVAFEDVDGTYLLYVQPGGGNTAQQAGTYVPLDDDTAALGYTLTLTGAGTAARLALVDDAGVTTTWAHLSGGDWVQESVTEPGSTGATTFTHDGQGRITRILAPVPEGVTCTGTLTPGCRALDIAYFPAGASGDGAYPGRVASVTYHAWDPTLSAMGSQLVVTYRYDASGYLESVTDDRSDLATIYTYGTTTAAGVPLLTSVTPGGLAAWRMTYGTSAQGDDSLLTVTRDAAVLGDPAVTFSRFVYGVATSSMPSGTPSVVADVQAWGQTGTAQPTYMFATFGPGDDPGTNDPAQITAAQWRNARLSFTDDLGYTRNTADYGAGRWLYTAIEFDEGFRIVRELDAAATATVIDQSVLNGGLPVAQDEVNALATITRYNDTLTASTNIVWDGGTIAAGTVLVPAGALVTDTWSPASDDSGSGPARVHTHVDYDQGAPNNGVNPRTGQAFSLVTRTTTTRADVLSGHWDLTIPVATGEAVLGQSLTGYDPIDGANTTGDTSGWILGAATTSTEVMADPADNIISKTRYDTLGRIVESRAPGADGTDAGTSRTVYYTGGANVADNACGGRPEWAGLACVTRSGEATPTVPVVRTTGYSFLLAPTTTEETLDGVTRTSTMTYLADGRTDTTTVTVNGLTGSTPIPTTRVLYDANTGLPMATVTLDANSNETGRVSTTSDLWGRTITYTASNGDTATTTYDTAGRLASVNDGKKVVSYTYDGSDAAGNEEHRGLATGMTITGVGAFAAAYDAGGNMTRQTMPGDLTQERTYSLTGEPVSMTYSGVDALGDTIPLIGWAQVSDLFGRVIAENTPSGVQDPSSVGEYSRTYAYDRAGRLITVEDRTAGVGEGLDGSIPCVTRTYDFDVRGNRLARHGAVSTDSTCTTVGGSTDAWTYDDADRVHTGANTTGTYVYDELGRQTTLPAIDSPMGTTAGDVTIGYHDNDLVRSLTQNGVTTTFDLDALGRRTTATTVTGSGTSTLVRHYADASDNPAWAVATGTDGIAYTTWYGTSLGGDLALTITDDVVSVQLADIHGDTALPITLDSSGDIAAIGGYADYDEYGRPLTGTTTPATGAVTYGWLGGKERATDTTGLLLMGVRLYNPTTGLFTSVDPITGGNTTAYTYPQDPINKYDTSGKSWWSKLKSTAKTVWKKHGRRITHWAINFAIGTAIAAATVAVCAGTAGIGCIVAAGAAFAVLGGMVGVAAHASADKYVFRHRTTGREAVRYAYGPAKSAIRRLGLAAWSRR